MNIICGLIPKSSGDVLIFDRPLESGGHSLGYLPERLPLYDDMRVEEYLEFVFAIFAGQNKNHIEKTLERCSLGSVRHQLIGTLSRGFRQRVAIAQAIVHSPKIIILDEPTLGLDPNSNLEVRSLILELKKDHTIFLSTHLLSEAELLCDNLTLIHQGQVVVSDLVENVKNKLSEARKMKIKANNWSHETLEKIKLDLKLKDLRLDHDTLTIDWSRERGEPFQLLHFILERGVKVQEFVEHKESLEHVFYELTKSHRPKEQGQYV